jgi:hypothetical protein
MEQDLTIEVEARLIEGPAGSEMGIVCRWQDDDNYVAGALRNDGMVSVWRKSGGVDMRWLDWTALPPSGEDPKAVRALRLTCAGSDVRFAVDGVEVATASDPAPTAGSLALIAGPLEPGPFLVAFDQFEARQP